MCSACSATLQTDKCIKRREVRHFVPEFWHVGVNRNTKKLKKYQTCGCKEGTFWVRFKNLSSTVLSEIMKVVFHSQFWHQKSKSTQRRSKWTDGSNKQDFHAENLCSHPCENKSQPQLIITYEHKWFTYLLVLKCTYYVLTGIFLAQNGTLGPARDQYDRPT